MDKAVALPNEWQTAQKKATRVKLLVQNSTIQQTVEIPQGARHWVRSGTPVRLMLAARLIATHRSGLQWIGQCRRFHQDGRGLHRRKS